MGLSPTRWVVRGGSAMNVIRGAVRPMFRGWEEPRLLLPTTSRAFRESEPRPPQDAFHRIPWTGFRCAWLEAPGESRLRTMANRLEVSTQLSASSLDDHFVALDANDHAPDGALVVEGRFVQGRAHSLALQPFRLALTVRGRTGIAQQLASPGLTDADKVNEALRGRPLHLALFHTDWPLRLSQARVYPTDPRRQPTWYGAKELTGTYVLYFARGKVWLWHLATGRHFRLGRGTAVVREGAKPFEAAEPKVSLRAEPVRRTSQGRVRLRVRVPYTVSTDAKHLWLDVTASFDVDRPTTLRTLRPLQSGGR